MTDKCWWQQIALTEGRRQILLRLSLGRARGWAPQSAREISSQCGHRTPRWASDKLRDLWWHNLVQAAGSTPSGATTWVITDKGILFLERNIDLADHLERVGR